MITTLRITPKYFIPKNKYFVEEYQIDDSMKDLGVPLHSGEDPILCNWGNEFRGAQLANIGDWGRPIS